MQMFFGACQKLLARLERVLLVLYLQCQCFQFSPGSLLLVMPILPGAAEALTLFRKTKSLVRKFTSDGFQPGYPRLQFDLQLLYVPGVSVRRSRFARDLQALPWSGGRKVRWTGSRAMAL